MDTAVLEQLQLLEGLGVEVQIQIVALGIQLLEGRDVSEELKQLSTTATIAAGKLGKMCSAASSVLWECSKFSPKDQLQNMILDLLIHSGISSGIAPSFSQVFIDNKRRILSLKGSLGVSAFSYQNLSWRLEVELAKRSLQVTSEPRYLLRVDLVNKAVAATAAAEGTGTSVEGKERDARVDNGKEKYRSHHLQADHATMKLLEQELQRAVDEVNSVHCQRISRYMS